VSARISRSRSRKVRDGAVVVAVAAAFLAPLAAGAFVHSARPETVAGMPRPRVVEGPPSRTTMRTAQFVLGDRAHGARFECSLDGAPFEHCSRTPRYGVRGAAGRCRSYRAGSVASEDGGRCAELVELAGLSGRNGGHVLRVVAIGVRGSRSQTIAYRWTIVPETTFTLSLARPAQEQLYPGGPALAIPLVIGNPSDQTLFVERLVVTASTDSASCPASRNLKVTGSDVSGRRPIRVGPHEQVTLPAEGVTAPTVRMLELPVNQDGCKDARVKLHYVGAGRS